MRRYETVIILRATLSEAEAKDVIDKIRKSLKDLAASISHEEGWGRKASGYYHLFEYHVSSGAINEFESGLKRNPQVLRFMTVNLGEVSG